MALKKFFTILFVLALITLVVVGIYSALQLRKTGQQTTETAPLPEIDIYKILPSSCEECFDIAQVEQFVQQKSNAKILENKAIKSSTEEAKELIKKYKITRLPAMIIKGEIDRISLKPFEKREDVLVFDTTPPPYFEVDTAKIKGKISATIITDTKCKQCFDLRVLIKQLKQMGVFVTEKITPYDSLEGKNLIQKYKIKKVPSLLLSKDAQEYSIITSAWDVVGTQETDGTLVLRTINPPFRDLETNEITKEPSVIFITDNNCKECYNVTLHKNLFAANFGMKFADEKYVDASSKEGTRLLNKYKINLVPTIIISPEAKEYSGFTEIWKQVGDVAVDGSFVFKKLELLKGMIYKDLKTKKLVNATNSP